MALNLYEIRKASGAAGEFFAKIGKQTPSQYQGLYVVSPDGEVLSSRGAQPKKGTWEADTLKMLAEGLKAFGPVTVRKVVWVDPKPDRGTGVRDDGSIVLAVAVRSMVLGLDKRGLGAVALDSVVLTSRERSDLSVTKAEVGDTWKLPARMVAAFHRVLSPTSDANNLARRDEVTKAQLVGKVERVSRGVAYYSFRGEIAGVHIYEFEPHKGKKIRAAVTLRGVGSADARTGRLLSFTLVGEGVYRHHPPYDDESKYGAVVEWRRSD